jgi:hypothetical protein
MVNLKKYEFWFIVGSQDLYGDKTLEQVAANAKIMADEFAKDSLLPGTLVLKPIAITPAVISRLFGCLLFPLQKCGYKVLQRTASRFCICIPSLTVIFHGIP